MPVTTGRDVTIEIDGTDYSNYIYSIEESGGEKIYTMVKTYGQRYRRVFIGYEPYSLTFSFRLNDTDLKELFEETDPITIVITDPNQEITYHNMLPTALNYGFDPEDLSFGTITYEAPPFDKTTGKYNRILSF